MSRRPTHTLEVILMHYSTIRVKGEKHMINPNHYKTKSMESIDVIRVMTEGLTGYEGYMMGNIIKYLYRYHDKGGTKDLEKAMTYIGFLKDQLECDIEELACTQYYLNRRK